MKNLIKSDYSYYKMVSNWKTNVNKCDFWKNAVFLVTLARMNVSLFDSLNFKYWLHKSSQTG